MTHTTNPRWTNSAAYRAMSPERRTEIDAIKQRVAEEYRVSAEAALWPRPKKGRRNRKPKEMVDA